MIIGGYIMKNKFCKDCGERIKVVDKNELKSVRIIK